MTNTRQVRAEILIVGNELLNGTTMDTNSFWLAKELSKLGIRVDRKTTVRDELKVISKSFSDAVARKPDWLISIGGLGPTYDDLTVQALSLSIGRKLELDNTALAMLKESRRRRDRLFNRSATRITRSALKMVKIPLGSLPLPNSVGSAPGVLVEFQSTTIVSLPGVPAEMKAIFSENVKPKLRAGSNFYNAEKWIVTLGASESRLSTDILRISKRYDPLIYIKSHPMGFKKGRPVLNLQITLTCPRSEWDKGVGALEAATSDMVRIVEKLGAAVRRGKSI